jgi:hypothetical protein
VANLEGVRTILAHFKFMIHNYCSVQQVSVLNNSARRTGIFHLTFLTLVTGIYEGWLQDCYWSQTMLTNTSLYVTHSWSWTLLEKLPIVHLLKSFPAFYGTRRFITVPKRALHWSLSWARSIKSMPSYLSKIHFNIVHRSTSWSSQWSVTFWLSTNSYMQSSSPPSSLTWSF